MRKSVFVPLSISLCLLSLLPSCSKVDADGLEASFPTGENISVPGYTLKQAVVLSRHNIRSPLSAPGSILERVTPHDWHKWSSSASELSLKGGVLETEMGQYFRKWLESEELFEPDTRPNEDEIRVYANAKQRTIATANYFLSGLLPSENIMVETHAEFNAMDPVFHPRLTFLSDSYGQDAKKQILSLFKDDIDSLKDNYSFLTEVIGLKESKAYQEGEIKGFVTDDTQLSFTLGEEPSMKGSLKTGCSVADALVLQYYEEEDEVKAGFGKKLSFEQWKAISHIKDLYGDVLFSAPLIANNVSYPLLKEIEGELDNQERKFAYLCGHDSNLCSVLSSLDVLPYSLPGSVEEKTPIGSKLVFSTFLNPEGEEHIRVDMVYQNVEYLRNATILDLDTHPTVTPLRFANLTADSHGLYGKEDFLLHLKEAINQYDIIKGSYADVVSI